MVFNEDEDEDETYEEQVCTLSIDAHLHALLEKKSKDDDNDKVKVDCMKWWILLRPKYPIVFKLVTAAISIFHGPHDESNFNVMGDVIDKHSGQLNMETYSSNQDVKYALKARQPCQENHSISKFSRKDRFYSSINSSLVSNMR